MYLALYRKYRPRTFEEVISQPHITVTLQNQIKSGQIAHAYLFTGSRGTGKTTCAKILARQVNGIDADTDSIDIQEIDAASNNGVDDIRALREEAGYLPSELKYKVYIIDEVHMLSTSAFNALLKTLEEPPPHVIFILATTEIHKIPATVLSRCQRFEFNRIRCEESAAALIAVAEKEGIILEKDAAMLIARLSDGGMRDALSLLDVCAGINAEDGKKGLPVTQATVRDCAGIAGKEHLFAIADAIANGDGKTALTITAELYAKSKDPSRLIDELLQHFRNLMLVKLMPEDFSLLTALPEECPDYVKQACHFTIESIMDCLDTLEDCLRLKGRKVEAEICLMKMCVKRRTVSPAAQPVVAVEVALPPPVVPEPPPPEPPAVSEPPPPPEPVASPQTPSESPPALSEWQLILENLDAYQASMLEEASVDISGKTIIISGGEVLQYFFDNPANSIAIEKAARQATGIDYKAVFDREDVAGDEVVIAPPIAQEPPKIPKIEQFLSDVKESGIQLTIQ